MRKQHVTTIRRVSESISRYLSLFIAHLPVHAFVILIDSFRWNTGNRRCAHSYIPSRTVAYRLSTDYGTKPSYLLSVVRGRPSERAERPWTRYGCYKISLGGPTSTPIAGVDDVEEFRATQQALSTVGVSVEKQWVVFGLLSSLLHLGNAKVTQARNEPSDIDEECSALVSATRFLGVSLSLSSKNGPLRSRSSPL